MKNKTTTYQIIILALALVLVFGMFSLPKIIVSNEEGLIVDKKKKDKGDTEVMHQQKLSKQETEKLNHLRAEYLATEDLENKNIFADSLIHFFRNTHQYDSAAFYAGAIAKLDGSQKNLIKAGNENFYALQFFIDTDKATSFGTKARNFYQKVLQKDAKNLDVQAKVALTYTYPEGNPNTMKGVNILREIVSEKEPTHELSLLHLAKLSMFRQGFTGAIKRLETLLDAHPENEEAQFYLAECYRNTGNKTKALELLEKLKNEAQDTLIKQAVEQSLEQLQ